MSFSRGTTLRWEPWVIDDDSLREKVSRAIGSGQLPNRLPDRVWGGQASSGRCAVCGELMNGIEFELVFAEERRAAETSYRVHRRCLKAFERAVTDLREPPPMNGHTGHPEESE